MNLRKFLTVIFCIIFYFLNAQENSSTELITESDETESNLYIRLDIANRYIWRGLVLGGNHIAIQPTIEYAVSNNLTMGIWGTTNFQNKDYNSDGTPKGYVEFNFYAKYELNDFLHIELWDYYWPNLDNDETINNNFFNYGEDSSKSVDLYIVSDFSEIWLPFNATISTLIAGNDFKYDDTNNAKRNFTTYVELGYTFKNIINTFDLSPTIGAVLNNKAKYYKYADYDKVTFINLNLNLQKELEFNNNLVLPISLQYIHNTATKNTEETGKNFFTVTISLEF